DTGSAGQPLLGHGDAVPSSRCGDGSDEPSWPAAENHQVVFTAFSVGPIRRMALLDSLLVVNVSGEKFDDRHRVSSLDSGVLSGARAKRRWPEWAADSPLGDERLGHRALAERLAQNRPVHRLVAKDAGDGLGEVAVAKNRNHAKIAARRALLEAGREAQHVYLSLQRLDREVVVGGLFRL